MAPLALFNEGVRAHFFHLIKAPTMRLQSAKMLFCWPSRMHIYGFIENRTFLEQFVSMGVQDHFLYCGDHNEAPHRNVLEPLNGKRLSEAKECQSD